MLLRRINPALGSLLRRRTLISFIRPPPPLLHRAVRQLSSGTLAESMHDDMEAEHRASLDPDLMEQVPGGLADAIHVLLEQEDQGIAADATQNLFFTTALQNSQLHDAALAYFKAGKDRQPNTETYTSLIYVCVKLRRLDDGFTHFESMMSEGILPDCRVYAHLLKGCGRTRQIRRGEAFFRLLKQRKAPHVYDRRVYNAVINMYAHQKGRGQTLLPSEAEPAWLAFDEMQQRGVIPDEITYNSLISMCARLMRPDVPRALELMSEMEAIGIPVSGVTLASLMQVLGRANQLPFGREQLSKYLSGLKDKPFTAIWRPLLHSAAVSGDVEAAEGLYNELLAACGSSVFDSFKHRTSHAFNYVILAHGYANGYDAARSRLDEARALGQIDVLSYSFMFELAMSLHGRLGRKRDHMVISEDSRKLALGLWEDMKADGIEPHAALCHRMFHVWVAEGNDEMAEETFEKMKQASKKILDRGKDLASRWLGGDLDEVKRLLSDAPLAESACYTSSTYVKLITAYTSVGKSEKAALHLDALFSEAAEKDIILGHETTTPLLNALSAKTASDVGMAVRVHEISSEAGRPCAPQPSLGLCNALLKQDRYEDAVGVLMRMALPRRELQWAYAAVNQRIDRIAKGVGGVGEEEERIRLEGLLGKARERFGIEEAAKEAVGAEDGVSTT